MNFLIFNGELRKEDESLLRADNRGFRYGDGLFETMLVRHDRVRLGQYHLDRMNEGLHLLGLDLPQAFSLASLEASIAELAARNGYSTGCRARLTVFREAAGLYQIPDRRAAYFLQTSGLGPAEGDTVSLGVFPGGRKACDVLSGIKSNNYLLSSLAGMHARKNGWDECILLNAHGRVAETAAANIWWVRGSFCFTPPLTEGCVAGVMRRFLLAALPAGGYTVKEEAVEPGGLAGADEIFISNAIRGVRGVVHNEGRRYGTKLAAAIQRDIIQEL